jgi:hypothetical protein
MLQGRGHAAVPVLLLAVAAISRPALPQAGVKPKVTLTDPANGATGISRYKPCIAVTFDTPMSTSYCGIGASPNWQIGGGAPTCTRSEGRKTMTSCRHDKATNPLAYGTVVQAILLSPWIVDADGDMPDTYSLSFTVEVPEGTGKVKVPANPSAGFSWPYYLYTPANVKLPAVLMVEPNNTGTVSDDPAIHDAAASGLLDAGNYRADDQECPISFRPLPGRPRTPPCTRTPWTAKLSSQPPPALCESTFNS